MTFKKLGTDYKYNRTWHEISLWQLFVLKLEPSSTVLGLHVRSSSMTKRTEVYTPDRHINMKLSEFKEPWELLEWSFGRFAVKSGVHWSGGAPQHFGSWWHRKVQWHQRRIHLWAHLCRWKFHGFASQTGLVVYGESWSKYQQLQIHVHFACPGLQWNI